MQSSSASDRQKLRCITHNIMFHFNLFCCYSSCSTFKFQVICKTGTFLHLLISLQKVIVLITGEKSAHVIHKFDGFRCSLYGN